MGRVSFNSRFGQDYVSFNLIHCCHDFRPLRSPIGRQFNSLSLGRINQSIQRPWSKQRQWNQLISRGRERARNITIWVFNFENSLLSPALFFPSRWTFQRHLKTRQQHKKIWKKKGRNNNEIMIRIYSDEEWNDNLQLLGRRPFSFLIPRRSSSFNDSPPNTN